MPDSLTSQAEFARLKGVSRNAVSQAIKRGILKDSLTVDANGVKQIRDVEHAMREWASNADPQRRDNAAGGIAPPPRPAPAPGGDVEDLATSTERLKAAQADIAELKLAEAKGELVSRDAVALEWTDLLSTVRTKLLGLPTAIKQSIPTLTVADVLLIENAIREALEDLVAAEIPSP